MLHYLAAVAMAASAIAATPGKVQWQADYGKALAATRSDQRPLLVVLDVPANPQASFSSELLTTEGEQGKTLAAYRLCRVDASTEYGKKVAAAFGATQLPHTAIIDRTGSVVLFKQSGQMASSDWNVALAKFSSGQQQTSFYRPAPVQKPVLQSYAAPGSKSYCPSCQRRASMSF